MDRQSKYKGTDTFCFHNANPKNRLTTGDCVLRAVSLATGCTWDETLDSLVVVAHKMKYAPLDDGCYDRHLIGKGFFKMKQPRKSDGTKYTGSEFCQYLQEKSLLDGRCYSVVAHIGGHHIVAIQRADGRYKVHDTWDSTDGCIGNYWIKEMV